MTAIIPGDFVYHKDLNGLSGLIKCPSDISSPAPELLLTNVRVAGFIPKGIQKEEVWLDSVCLSL